MADTFPRKTKWVLTEAAFARLLAWLDGDQTRAGQKYEEIRRSLMKFFEYRGCLTPDEHTDETIDRVARRISEGVEVLTDNPFLYFYGVALRVLQEYQRKQAMRPPEPPPAPDAPEVVEIRLQCMERCFGALPAETREMIAEYCKGEKRGKTENRNTLAGRMGVSLNTLRIRVHRIRAQLDDCMRECVRKSEEG
jgi:DNA-directed RNA polymerase specialized sigma24 family protein